MVTKADTYMVASINNILNNGVLDQGPRPHYADGTPAHTYFVTHQLRQYDLSHGEYPICTLRPIPWKTAIKEMFWIFQMRSNNLKDLHDLGVMYWDNWESNDYPDTIGWRYGHTVGRYDLFNKCVLDDIKENPYSRYHICNLWQEEEFKGSDGLKPCAYETIWTVRGEYLDMFLNQRSGDLLAASGGGGVNEVQYAALLMMVARHTGYKPGVFSHFVVNEQIYDRHLEQAKEMLKRYNGKREKCISNIDMILNPSKSNFYDFSIEDFTIKNYEPIKPQIRFELGI